MKLVLMNPGKKRRKTKMATRRKRRVRRNPARKARRGGSGARKTRPVLYKKRGRYYASGRTRTIKRGTRINPARRRRTYRRNPSLLKGFTVRGIMKQLKPIAFGAVGGIVVNKLFNRFVILQNENLVPWVKLGAAVALPMLFRKGVLGESAKYGAIVVGAAALKQLATQFMPDLVLDGDYDYSYLDPQSHLGYETVQYPNTAPSTDYGQMDMAGLGFEDIAY